MPVVIAVFAVVMTVVGAFGVEASEETRSASGTGSRGLSTDVEFYVLAGTYVHDVVSDCEIAASLFPASREPAALLRDVLQADLATGDGRVDSGTLVMTAPGWINLQIGTGPQCAWEYSITGAFLPLGSEPSPPRAADDLGELWGFGVAMLIVGAVAVIVARRRRPSRRHDTEEVKVRVTPPP